jgi:hypothetical protein
LDSAPRQLRSPAWRRRRLAACGVVMHLACSAAHTAPAMGPGSQTLERRLRQREVASRPDVPRLHRRLTAAPDHPRAHIDPDVPAGHVDPRRQRLGELPSPAPRRPSLPQTDAGEPQRPSMRTWPSPSLIHAQPR